MTNEEITTAQGGREIMSVIRVEGMGVWVLIDPSHHNRISLTTERRAASVFPARKARVFQSLAESYGVKTVAEVF